MSRVIATVITVLVTLLFPLVIWLSHDTLEPRWLAVPLLLAAITRLWTFKKKRVSRWVIAIWVSLAALSMIAMGWNALLPLKFYPVLVSLVLLIAFGFTLLFPPSMIEIFARMSEPNLPPIAVAYTRRVTQVWCGFFVVNGSIAFLTVMWATEGIWLLYNGLISYVLMGLLFGGEFLYRQRFKRIHHV